jgi:MFS family permease
MNFWTPTFLQRIHELTPAEYSLPFGLATGLGGGLGAYAGGALTSWAIRRRADAFLSYPAASMLLFAVALAVTVTAQSLPLLYSAVFVAAFAQFFLMGPFFGLVQRLAPLRGRAVATAFYFFILSIVGLGVGLFYVGAVNDLLSGAFGDAEGLRLSLLTLAGISVIAAAIAYLGRGSVTRELAEREAAAPASA